ncbi:MAG: hypothetical protein AAFU79_18345 [Myxococcota bacterium]
MTFEDYSFILIRDGDEELAGLMWTEHTHRQGFCRTGSVVNILVPAEWDYASVSFEQGKLLNEAAFTRLFRFPFHCPSGVLLIGAADEHPGAPRRVSVEPGEYGLMVGMRTGRETNHIEVVAEKLASPLIHSEVLIADQEIEVGEVLVEDADVA